MWYRVAGVAGALAVMAGAFGAHGLREILSEQLMNTWNTAALYHLVHSLALLAVAAHPRRPAVAGWLFVAGITLFSGSLYAMGLANAVTGESYRLLGAITPIGGVCFIAGWLTLAFWRTHKRPEDA